MVNEFENIRPYHDSEIHEAMQRIVSNPMFGKVVKFLYPDTPMEEVEAKFRAFNSTHSFQSEFMDFAIQSIINHTSTGLSYSGMENLSPEKRYLFLSNHRDILLDSAILQILLVANNLDTTEISFGDNLMNSGFIIDIGKSNKMFRLIRGGTLKQIFHNSMHTSKYMRYAIAKKRQSVWIAQRNGRTKDGNDQTQQTVLKMLGMGGKSGFMESFAQLNLTPTAISFQYDPCDILKTREIYSSRRKPYIKAPDEDLNSIITGIIQPKGMIHLAIAPPITEAELSQIEELSKNERIQNLATLIDKRIYQNYRLWKSNYIAYDILHNNYFEKYYSDLEKKTFIDYMNKMLEKMEGDRTELQSIFLGIYANPVVNHIRINGPVEQNYPARIFEYKSIFF